MKGGFPIHLFTIADLAGAVSAQGCWGGLSGLASQQMVADYTQRRSISAGRAIRAELIPRLAEVTLLLSASTRPLGRQYGGFLKKKPTRLASPLFLYATDDDVCLFLIGTNVR